MKNCTVITLPYGTGLSFTFPKETFHPSGARTSQIPKGFISSNEVLKRSCLSAVVIASMVAFTVITVAVAATA